MGDTRVHQKRESVPSNRGSTFHSVEAEATKKGLTDFELYLMMGKHIAQTDPASQVSHREFPSSYP
jgi:hypothetical protein